MANEARGEFEIVLDGEPYGMRPSHEAVQAYEAVTGKSNAELYVAAAENTLTRNDAAVVVTECCKAWGLAVGDKSAPHFNVKRVGELLGEADGGMLLARRRLQTMLWLAETGGVTSLGEMKATTTETMTKEATPAPVSAASPVQPSGGRPKRSGSRRQ